MPGFEWKGSRNLSLGKGSWYNPVTKEMLYPDLKHPVPIELHWDYIDPYCRISTNAKVWR